MKKITRKMFVAATGRKPIQDDLERCNCKLAGTIGHFSCGWDERANLPQFDVGPRGHLIASGITLPWEAAALD